ncbi:DUF6301 family protein [Nocardia sp. NPDC051321]|uniref:DUF6301 family protein n=1 Tax=Nocardia sp. NPDC051321 TaxID=3364323 RepID=UPI00378C6BE2
MDLAGAVEVVRAAVDFDWTWRAGDVEGLCTHLGWDEPTPAEHDDTLWWARSWLAVEDAVATFQLHGDRLDTIILPITAEGCGSGAPGAATFAEAVAAFCDAWGDPTGEWICGRNGPSWVIEDLVVGVSHGVTIDLILTNQLTQRNWADRRHRHTDGWANAGKQLTDNEVRFVRLAGGLVRFDPGAWSRDAIESVLTGLELLSDDAPHRALELSLGDGLSLNIRDDPGDLYKPYGYGEVRELELELPTSGSAGDNLYRAAFEACRSSLGAPDLIAGGTELVTTWIDDAVTARLTRRYRGNVWWGAKTDLMAIKLSLSPTEPTQNWLEDRSVNATEYDGGIDPEPPERWHLQLDVRRGLKRYIGNLAEPAWCADSFSELNLNLSLLFTSLADDLRLLPNIVEIGWAVGVDASDVIAHGWFSAISCGSSILVDGTVRTRNYPPTKSVGPVMADATVAAVRAYGTGAPHELWCDAWTVGRPHELVAVRCGLRGDRPAPIKRRLDQ